MHITVLCITYIRRFSEKLHTHAASCSISITLTHIKKCASGVIYVRVGVGGIPVLVVNHGMKLSPATYGYILKITVIPKLVIQKLVIQKLP